MNNLHGTPKRIVVGVDESESAQQAAVWAAREARRRGDELLLVSAYEEPLPRPPESSPDMPGPRAQAEALLETFVTLAREASPETSAATRLVHGWPEAVLAEAAQGAEMLVVGSRGRGRLSAAFAGSIGVELAATAPVPLVVVRGPDPGSLPEAGVLPIVVGLDTSPVSVAAARFGAAEAAWAGDPLVLLHVSGHDNDATDPDELVARLRSEYPGLDVTVRRASGHVATALVDCSSSARLLVVGTRGRGGFAGLVLGSVTQSLMRRAQCPLGIISPLMTDWAGPQRDPRSSAQPRSHQSA